MLSEAYRLSTCFPIKKAVFLTYNLLNIVYDNWKELLTAYEVKEAKTVIDPIMTDEDIEKI